jgi:murein L,D-transpeptidase YafK
MSFRRPLEIALRFGALAMLATLAACNDTGVSQRSLAPIPSETLALMEQVGTTKEAPVLIRAYKKEAELQVWKMRSDGKYVHLKTFPMCRWSGQLGPKTHEGDRQVPEGFYSITQSQLNPNSNYYLSFNVGYPNAFDRAHGYGGGLVMVHGACSSAGCFSMTDKQVAEIYAIARTALNGGQQRAIQMQSYPFKMTAENLARHRLDPNIGFWKQLKEGNDHFEVTKEEPKVAVCGRRYVFDATSANGQSLDAGSAACPPLKYDEDVRQLAAEKAARDEEKIAALAEQIRPVRLVYQDGGQHPDFTSRVAEVGRPELLTPPTEIALDERPVKAGKATAKLAAKSPLVTMAAAKAAKEAAPESSATLVAAAPKDADTETTGSTGWLGLHKDQAKAAKAAKPGAGSIEQALQDSDAAARK